ncbi:hypothetical protein BDR07DRAFT_1379138 [Suillus spraguei]|nr:hypothetical protein BDR07DRAFT_1379138 [Suillus spraguei]
MPRQKSTAKQSCAPQETISRPRKRLAVMSVSKSRPAETCNPNNDKGSTSSGATAWAEDPWPETEQMSSSSKRGPTVVGYCNKPGQFWPDGEEPPSKGQKSRKRVFITKGKFEARKEITRDNKEIRRLKDADRSSQSFHPKSGDIELYHDYSDYDGTDEEDMFNTDDNDFIPSPTISFPAKTRADWFLKIAQDQIDASLPLLRHHRHNL